MSKRKAEHELREKTGPKYSVAGRWAVVYGVPLRAIYKIRLERFEAMSEEARQIFCQWTRSGNPYGAISKDFKRGGIKKLYPWRHSCAAAVDRSGKTTADWMELMARSPQWWEERPARGRPIKSPMPSEFKLDPALPDEQGWRVAKLTQLAEKLRVA